MKVLWLAVILFLTGVQAHLAVRRLMLERPRAEAIEQVKRLAYLTAQLFPGGRPAIGDSFWRTIERTSPMLDPWGKAYVLESIRFGLYRWSSAGPDGGYGTEDDIESYVPYKVREEPTHHTLPVTGAQ